MAKPVRERIIEAVRAELATIGLAVILFEAPSAAQIAELGELGLARVAIARDGLPPELPAISIEDRGDTKISQDGYSCRKWLNLEILGDVDVEDLDVGTAEGEEVAELVRSELSRRYQQLAAQIEAHCHPLEQWGGLAALTEIGNLDVEIVEGADPRTATTAQAVRIQYAHRTGDPFTAAS